MHYYQFNIKTYAASTAHLTDGEDLAYRRLIDFYYDTEKPIPTALPLVCRRLRLALPDVESVLNEFFLPTNDGWKHAFIDQEMADYHAFIARQKTNGSKGGRGRKADAKPDKPTALPDKPSAKPTNNHKQETINNKQDEEAKASGAARLVEKPETVSQQVWSDFIALRKKKSAPLTETAWQQIQKEADKAGWPIDDALKESCARGWQGFKADWVAKDAKPASNAFAGAI